MVTQHFESAQLPPLRQSHPAMPLVLDQRLGGTREFLQHIRYGSRRHSEPICQPGATDAPIPWLTQGEDSLQIIVHRFGICVRLAACSHGPALFLQLDFYFILGDPKN
jgi:hypothetical protein